MKKMNIEYREVKLDNNGEGFIRKYTNPLSKTYQYEYALYKAMVGRFGAVIPKSRCLNSLMLYFKELPHKNEIEDGVRKKSQEDILDEIESLISRDIIGNIYFPMMNICAAEVITKEESDGMHSFTFTDGIYGFRLCLDMQGKGRPKRILVEDIFDNEDPIIEKEIA